ncbi:MAG TPA: tRNA uridine-5-carboxymethylaminomethyl(34) synthesis GTPase MnmE, partial [Candidatus Megaira endosymbiont of Hartmannula sinica]|nr:tRNA uridine-5-carboxymethylaminomethyl(34) synthesis GTPase MnmE [Candidatus Megaera endosymbiont of Hartmannula sinica]
MEQNNQYIVSADTIFARSTSFGKSGVCVFRISGSKALDAVNRLLLKNEKIDLSSVKARYMYLRNIYKIGTCSDQGHANMPSLIDQVMIVYFNNGHSFTGEDVIEIHSHGSIAIIKIIIEQLHSINYLRHAEAGEFTKRAFLNGKFDLTRAEGLGDLLEAQTEFQHAQAISQYSGILEQKYNSWRQDIIKIMSLIEAYIDFPDEDIDSEVIKISNNKISQIKDSIANHLNDNNKGEKLRNGVKVAIVGRPNSGKSTLTNLIVGRDMAITSDIAGTTTDVMEAYIDIGGYPIILQDTAGIRTNSDSNIIEQIGIGKAKITPHYLNHHS